MSGVPTAVCIHSAFECPQIFKGLSSVPHRLHLRRRKTTAAHSLVRAAGLGAVTPRSAEAGLALEADISWMFGHKGAPSSPLNVSWWCPGLLTCCFPTDGLLQNNLFPFWGVFFLLRCACSPLVNLVGPHLQ